ncbi:hypothetical protein BK5-Tp03 [Lactococcus phage BK5-T]|uniref:Uncharacterized protein n=1 Tax=Lactococcus phage BK5-T TaxID=31754 RepID=Q94MB2_9CAUD|nr:hypothetical protein BK5-Tp03 [Lactococcus phage BK5-T]YP_010133223.1 hypothetical protein K3164_gp03 [Lactococcus phage BK5-T]AAK56803.1 unknown [Lactococcus phage BK5-T]CAC80144.1 hypothetical protein [Lactococcus phage BK5-T]
MYKLMIFNQNLSRNNFRNFFSISYLSDFIKNSSCKVKAIILTSFMRNSTNFIIHFLHDNFIIQNRTISQTCFSSNCFKWFNFYNCLKHRLNISKQFACLFKVYRGN